MKLIEKKTFCRSCHGKKLMKVFSFGPTPLANNFLTQKELGEGELFFPLDVYFCEVCHFVQLGHVISPEVLFKNYVYVSSTSPVFVAHFAAYANSVVSKINLAKDSFVVDIGSNDGILLKPFKALGMQVLGIEPAKNIAREAIKQDIATMTDFFSPTLAKKIVREYCKASVITANNVFAHIDDLDAILEAISILLSPEGVFIIEAPYLVDFFEKNYFDLVYHEHLSYLSIAPLQTLFRRHGMEIFDAEKTDVHGGSIRIWVQKKHGPRRISENVSKFIFLEKKRKLDDVGTYVDFSLRVLENKTLLTGLLTNLKKKKNTMAAYGAPAKGNTLLNYFGIGTDYLDFIVDDSPFKQGLFSPGRHIPVVGAETLKERIPDYLLILAWNFSESIMQKLAWYKKAGGKFIIPVPVPKIV